MVDGLEKIEAMRGDEAERQKVIAEMKEFDADLRAFRAEKRP
jgi:hypothetical protein